MRLALHLVSLAALALLFAGPALALPAPMADEELEEKSDLVALVRVLSVTCTSITKDERTGEDLPGYLAALQVIEVKKGRREAGRRGAGHLPRDPHRRARAVDRIQAASG